MTATIEQRAHQIREERPATGLTLREDANGEVSFSGVASTVEQAYTVRDAFGEFQETMREKAFNKTVKDGDVRLLVNHAGVPLARTPKTMTLSADPHLRADAPNLDVSNPTVQEVRSALRREDINNMSVGMRVIRDEWNKDYTERQIFEVQLFDVSIVTYPANPNTTANLRSLLYADLDGPDAIRAAIQRLQEMLAEPALDHPFKDDGSGAQCTTCGRPIGDHPTPEAEAAADLLEPMDQLNSAELVKLGPATEVLALQRRWHELQRLDA